jgi:hypothetical protein
MAHVPLSAGNAWNPPWVAAHAGEMSSELTLAVTSKLTLAALAETVLSTWSVAAGWRTVSAPSAVRLRCEV